MAQVLVCTNCGGPLPRPSAREPLVTCAFCHATTDVNAGPLRPSADTDKLSIVAVRERLAQELNALQEAYGAGIAQGQPPTAAFRAAAASALAAVCDPDAITNVVFGIAAEFDRKHGTEVTRDPNAIPRLATAYIDSLEQLAQQPRHEINLPFLTATPRGPLHFALEITIDRLQVLAATPPGTAEPPPAPPASDPVSRTTPEEPVAPTKPWYKRIFG